LAHVFIPIPAQPATDQQSTPPLNRLEIGIHAKNYLASPATVLAPSSRYFGSAAPASQAVCGDARVSGRCPFGGGDVFFTDVEGSTCRWEADADDMRVALAADVEVLRAPIEGHLTFR
jgi:hypothetical protein